jgi:dihydroflavonol-4-reductase
MSVGATVVTGGAGFIGSHLVERLVAAGERVVVVEKPGTDVSHLPASVEVREADIRVPEATRKALAGASRVYHLAGNPNLWVRDRREFDRVNHQGTLHVLDAALEAGCARVLHCSTESILTQSGRHTLIDEDAQPELDDAVGPYCRSKLLAERAARARAAAGQPVLIASPTMPVGPGDRRLSPPSRLIRDFCNGRIPARMDCTLNLVDVRDVAEGLVRTMERGIPGRRYLLGGENLTLLQVLEHLARHCPSPVPAFSVPYWASLAVAQVSELWADWISGAHPRATVTGVKLARRIMHFDSSRSRQELGLSPRPVEEALGDAVAWMRAHGLIEIREPSSVALKKRKQAEPIGKA